VTTGVRSEDTGHISERRTLLCAAAGYAVLTFVMALPFSAAPGSTVIVDAPDTHLYLWTLAWDAYAFVHQPLLIFDSNIYHPFANTLAYSENLIGTAFFAAPIIWLTGNLVLAMNLAALLTCVLCGLGAYVLARRLHLAPGPAFICGLVFAFAPPRFFKLGQLHMTAVQWMPFTLAYLHTYLEDGRRADLRKAVACFSLQALSSGHGAVFLTMASTALVGWRIVFGQPVAWRQRLRDFGVTGAYLLAPAVWVALPYRMAQADAGLKREFAPESQPGLESFFASPARLHLYLQQALWGAPVNDSAIAYLFPGLLLLALVVAAFWFSRDGTPRATARPSAALPDEAPSQTVRSRWQRNWTAFYGLLAVTSAALFVQWPVDVWPMVYWWPGFNFIRVPSRFMMLTMLALAVLGGIGTERLLSRFCPRRRTLGVVALAALLLAEYNSYPLRGVPFAIDIPPVDRWLATRPKPFVVAEMPVPLTANLGALERQQTMAMLHATSHWQRTIHGYSGIRRPLHERVYRELHTFPDAQSINSLRAVGVNYVVVHTDLYPPAEWPRVEDRLARTPELRLEYAADSGRIYSLVPR
jgi:hypothetical protein